MNAWSEGSGTSGPERGPDRGLVKGTTCSQPWGPSTWPEQPPRESSPRTLSAPTPLSTCSTPGV